ncbi:hypothetical protein ACHAXM_009255 [Skeletonema potamos]|jgi:hypothetical protein
MASNCSELLAEDVKGINIIDGKCESAKCSTNEINGATSTNAEVTIRVEPIADGDLIFQAGIGCQR